jgi:opacity protein-like surface antigen
MKRLTIALVLLTFAAAAPAAAAYRPRHPYREPPDNALRLRIGGFVPDGDSEYFQDKALDFSGDAKDLEDVSFGLDYRLEITPQFSLLFSGTLFEGQNDQHYLDFTDDRGNDIEHTTTLEIDSLTVGAVVHLLGPEAVVRPYLGAGGGLYSYRLEESGDFIDFNPPPPEIFNGTFKAQGETFGYYLLGGFEVPVSRNVAFFAEGRWQYAEDELQDDFEGFGDLDLGGRDLAAGITWRF